MVEAIVRAPVQPTESPARVGAAVRNVFPGASLEERPWGLEGPAGDLGRLGELIRAQRIPDTARGVLLRGQEGSSARFALNKQAAAVGRLNFAAREGPLGDIQVEVRTDSAEELGALIDHLAPDTRGWSLEARGLTGARLRALEEQASLLDTLERRADEGDEGDAEPGP